MNRAEEDMDNHKYQNSSVAFADYNSLGATPGWLKSAGISMNVKTGADILGTGYFSIGYFMLSWQAMSHRSTAG